MKNLIAKFCIDFFLWIAVTPLAYLLRVEGAWTQHMESVFWVSVMVLPVKGVLILTDRYFLQSWHRVGMRDLFLLIRGVCIYSAVFLIFAMVFRGELFIPYSVPFIEAMLLILSLGFVRFITRIWYEFKHQINHRGRKKSKRVLIAGAGEAGTMIAREMFRHPERKMIPVGFIDDDQNKQRQRFLGLPVLGGTNGAAAIIKKYNIETLLIAMPSRDGRIIRKIVEKAQSTGVEYKIIPAIHELISGEVSINKIRDVNLSDLLHRDPIDLNTHEIASYLKGRTILVTGAGGSIGSEIVRQIIPYKPKKLLLLGRGEYSIYKLEQELQQFFTKVDYHPIIADVRDRRTLIANFSEFKPEIVFHAAAHKHVPLMEKNPGQAILNNVEGTKNLVELSLKYDVKYFVNVSTDKAVNPTSIMGASKRVAEFVVEWGSARAAKEQNLVSVRFGNVLGSRGSVIPKFKEQIRRKEPITVTHPDMKRYFMTIPEASQLVLQAGGLNENGTVYVLEMGAPVKIIDLAKDLIKLSGLEPEIDIPVKISGIRPGEKLYEELMTSEEEVDITKYEKIKSAHQNGLPDNFEYQLDKLLQAALNNDKEKIRFLLDELIRVNELVVNEVS